MPIPKIMHFIWVGVSPIPEDRLAVIKRWYEQYPHFELLFWIDPHGTIRDVGEEVLVQQQQRLLNIGIKASNIKDIIEIGNPISMEIIRYEIDRLCPNYGAASDLIRYEILNQYGGVYLDSDVLPPEKELFGWWDSSLYNDATFWQNANHCYVYMEGHASDIIFSPQGAPGMMRFIQHVCKNYTAKKVILDVDASEANFYSRIESVSCIQAYAYMTDTYIRNSTLARTGSILLSTFYTFHHRGEIFDIKDAPRNVDWMTWVIEFIQERLLRMKVNKQTQESHIRVPLEYSEMIWLYLKPKEISNPKLAVQLIIASINFEISHFNILRLEDHLNDLDHIFQNMPEDKKFCYQGLINYLLTINITPDTVVQYPFRHTELTKQLMIEKSWFSNTCLFPVLDSKEKVNINRAVALVLDYFNKDIVSVAREIIGRISEGDGVEESLYTLACSCKIYLHFIDCVLQIVTEQKNTTIMEEILKTAEDLIACIIDTQQTVHIPVESRLEVILAKVQQSLVNLQAVIENSVSPESLPAWLPIRHMKEKDIAPGAAPAWLPPDIRKIPLVQLHTL